MTNREALEVIERFGVDSRGYPKLKEALDMAIEALTENDNIKRKIEILEHDIKAQTGGMYIDLTKVNATA